MKKLMELFTQNLDYVQSYVMRTDFLLYEAMCNCLVIDEGVVCQNFSSIYNKCTSVLHRSLLFKGKAAGITNWQWNACLQLEIPIQIGAEWEAINCK
jgi:hypothetical protein